MGALLVGAASLNVPGLCAASLHPGIMGLPRLKILVLPGSFDGVDGKKIPD
jgi:hypothetical protein